MNKKMLIVGIAAVVVIIGSIGVWYLLRESDPFNGVWYATVDETNFYSIQEFDDGVLTQWSDESDNYPGTWDYIVNEEDKTFRVELINTGGGTGNVGTWFEYTYVFSTGGTEIDVDLIGGSISLPEIYHHLTYVYIGAVGSFP